jgi:TctA family transporter
MFEVFEPALLGLVSVFTLRALAFLSLGVILGTVGAILPGVGGPSQLAIALPFVFLMKPEDAIPFLIGMVAVGNTGNTFTSVLVAVPGGSGSQATVLDGYPMAQKGQAARALSAAFMVSMMGGLVGAAVLVLSLPVLRPLVKLLGSPELFVLTLWGVCMIGTLSAGAPLKGLAGGMLGILLAVVGLDPKSGIARFDFGQPYLWTGISVVLVGLGMFALPELITLASRKGRVAEKMEYGTGFWQGVKDSFRHWWLMLRCATIGTWVGFLPGLGSGVADWFAYAHAKQTEKNSQLLGTGDVRGVIAPEASNNAKEGGALIPTLAFGIPGSTSLALLLVAFTVLGLRPGPDMLTDPQQLIFTWSIIWSLILSQIGATLLCMAIIKPTSQVALVPFYYLVPVVLALCLLSAFAANFAFADFVTLGILATLGYFMKQNGWPRAPLVLGFVLGSRMELFLWLSIARYGLAWLAQPVVIVLLLLVAFTVAYPFIQQRRAARAQSKVGDRL